MGFGVIFHSWTFCPTFLSQSFPSPAKRQWGSKNGKTFLGVRIFRGKNRCNAFPLRQKIVTVIGEKLRLVKTKKGQNTVRFFQVTFLNHQRPPHKESISSRFSVFLESISSRWRVATWNRPKTHSRTTHKRLKIDSLRGGVGGGGMIWGGVGCSSKPTSLA